MANSPVVVITGASQGIGAATARVFAEGLPGVRLALVARSAGKLAAVARAATRRGATAELFLCDVAEEAAVAAMAAAVLQRCGPPDVLVNNAGQFAGAPLAETGIALFDRQIAVNLRSVFLVSQAFLPAMLRRRRGDIFNMSSIAGLQAYPNGAAYCAAKFGVTGLTKVMRAELKDKGIRVTAVHPGATWTPSWAKSGFKAGRMIPAEDIARAMLDAHRLDRRTVVEEIVLRPQLGDI